MKKISFIVAIVATLLNVNVVKADVYSDGVEQLISDNILSASSLLKATNDKSAADLKNVIVEWVTPHFRQNMSETEFKQMIAFYSQPDMKAIQNKISSKLSNLDDKELQQQLMPGMMQVMQGQEAEPVKAPDCSADYKAAFDKYWEISNSDENVKSAMDGVFQMLNSKAGSENAAVKEAITAMSGYMNQNMKNIALTTCVKFITKDDLDTYNSVSNQPFFPAYQKASKAIADDLPSFIMKISDVMK